MVENFCDNGLLWSIDKPKLLECLQDTFQQMRNFSGREYEEENKNETRKRIAKQGGKGFTQERSVICPSICIFYIVSLSNQMFLLV